METFGVVGRAVYEREHVAIWLDKCSKHRFSGRRLSINRITVHTVIAATYPSVHHMRSFAQPLPYILRGVQCSL